MLEVEKKRFYQFLWCDMAHTVMLADRNIIHKKDAAKILSLLRNVEDLGPDKFPSDPKLGSFLSQIENYMAKRIGEEVAGRMHTGRSRNDQGACVQRLHSRECILRVIEALIGFKRAILNLADKHLNTIMPGYTHFQHAQPTTFGFYISSWFYKFERDYQRLKSAFQHTNLNPLGAAALVGTSWSLDRDRTTELMGFDDLVTHAMDAIVFSPEFPLEIVGALSIVMSNLGRLCADLYAWSTYEFNLVEFADEYCGTSSIMPQKKNPQSLERVLGLTHSSIGWMGTELGALQMVSSTGLSAFTGRRALQEASDTVHDMLDYMTGMLETLEVNKERARELVNVSWSTTNNLADVIVRKRGLSFRTAHRVVGRLVLMAIKEGKTPTEVTGKMLDNAAQEIIQTKLGLSNDAIRSALDPQTFLQTRTTVGSTNPNDVKKMISQCRSTLMNEEEWLKERRNKIKKAREQLDKAIAKYMEWLTDP
jgi:argininosuccinate lyase